MPKKPHLSDDDAAMRVDFGIRVTRARLSLGIKAADFAAAGGISMAHQYRIEAGERSAEVLYVQRLVARFGYQIIGALFGRHDEGDSRVVHIAGSNNVSVGRDVTGNVIGGKRKA